MVRVHKWSGWTKYYDDINGPTQTIYVVISVHLKHKHLCKPLCLIYNQSLQLGQLPEHWKLANVTPVFKNGQRNLPNNYHPISLTSQACKVLELIICDHIITFLSNITLICTEQHGFTYHKSCFTNLLEAFEDWTKSNDHGQGLSTDIVFLDFKKPLTVFRIRGC